MKKKKTINQYFEIVKKEYILKGGDIEYIEPYFGESIFGYDEFNRYISDGDSILEIGCGGGLLSSFLFQNGYNITAIEPHIGGFKKLSLVAKTVQSINNNFKIIESKIEDFDHTNKFDCIFSINVLEHVNDFRLLIKRASELLNPGGRILIMCPNYSFPYEPHFNLPVIINKNITYQVFSKYINNSDIHTFWDPIDCWNSLNWVSAEAIKRFCIQENYSYYFDKMVTKRILERVPYDKSLQKRKGRLNVIFNVLKRFHLHDFYSRLPLSFQPYLKFTVSNN